MTDLTPGAQSLLGRPAPGFSLPNQHGELITARGLVGRPAFLVFFPAVFSPICDGELRDLGRYQGRLAPARLLGVSTDTKFSLRAYAEAEGLSLELLSDHWPHGEVCRQYGAFDEVRGTAGRVTVLIDASGAVRDVFQSEPGQPRPLSLYFQALGVLEEEMRGYDEH